MRTPPLAVTALLLTVTATGCGTQSSSSVGGGDELTTPGALVYVAAEHAGAPDRAKVMSRRDLTSLFPEGEGAELRYRSDGEDDGDLLAVVVGRGLDPALLDCDTEQNARAEGCERTDDGVLIWHDGTPEEDPGTVTVIVEKDETTVLIGYTGPEVTDDPRDLELPISVDTLFAIASDPRVDVTTSAEAVEAGEEWFSSN